MQIDALAGAPPAAALAAQAAQTGAALTARAAQTGAALAARAAQTGAALAAQATQTGAALEARAAQTGLDRHAQFITCTLGDAEYGVDIMSVREIKGWTDTTAIPHAATWMRGVINLRGVIVPILDLRARFGLAPTTTTAMHVVVIIQTGARTAGLLVDAVSDIISVAPEEIRPVPDVGSDHPDRLIAGLVPLARGMVALVSLEHLLTFPDPSAPSLI